MKSFKEYFIESTRSLFELDDEYLNLYNNKEEQKAFDLVKLVANKKKYNVGPVYHGTTSTEFNEFDINKGMKGLIVGHPIAKYGFFFSPTLEGTISYRGETGRYIKAFLSFKKIHKHNMFGMNLANEKGIAVDEKVKPYIEKLKAKGYDGMELLMGNTVVEYMVFNPNQIKLADTFVFDNVGKLIPLSKRFNRNLNDIRY
jgi:hypothetical protein